MFLFDTFLILILSIVCAFMIGGYIIYKLYPESTEKWEDGVKYMVELIGGIFLSLGRFIYKKIREKLLTDQTVDLTFMIADQEALDLVDAFRDHPYDTPSLDNYVPNANGISWVDIKAVGVIERYKDITNEQIAKICSNIIQNYFMRTRGCQGKFYIRVATPTRLYFAVPLSEAGKCFLDRQEMSVVESVSNPTSDEPLTETVSERSADMGEDR